MYSKFAEYYDFLMEDADYKARTDYLLKLFDEFDRKPTLLCDLACGTGGFSNEFAERKIDVIGVDISEEMLRCASENSRARGLDILYLCQDISELDLYGTVDGAICCLDSLNHITEYSLLCKAFSRISLFLEKERLFIFDVNSLYKHEKILGDEAFVIEDDNMFLVWQNEYDVNSKITEITLDFFERRGDCYSRKTEYIEERAYTNGELEKALENAGLEILKIFGDMKKEAPKADEERLIYITRKVR